MLFDCQSFDKVINCTAVGVGKFQLVDMLQSFFRLEHRVLVSYRLECLVLGHQQLEHREQTWQCHGFDVVVSARVLLQVPARRCGV